MVNKGSKVCFWDFLLILFLPITGCDLQFSRLSSQTVVQINETQVSAKEFAERLARHLKDLDAITAKNPAHVKRIKDLILQEFIMEALVKDYASMQQVIVTEDELEKEINQLRSQYPDDLSFRRVLAQENISLKDWKEKLRTSLLDHKVFTGMKDKIPIPSLEEMKKYYSDKKESFARKDRVYLRQIVVDDLTKAKAIQDELKKTDFVKLAEKYSVSPEAKAGGLVGWVEKGTVDIFDKAFSLGVGGVSQILESPYGFHIFKVERKSSAGLMSFDEVKESIRKTLIAQKDQAEFTAWLDQRLRASRVSVNQELIQGMSVETRGLKK